MSDVKRDSAKNITNVPMQEGGATRRTLRKKKQKRRWLRLLFVIMIPLVVLTFAVYYSLTFFFKIETVEVRGDSRYSAEEIIGAAGVSTGKNLIFLDSEKVEKTVQKKLPYIGKLTIKKSLPSLAVIVVEETYPSKIVYNNGEFFLADKADKVLSKEEDITGLKLPIYNFGTLAEPPEAGKPLKLMDEISKKVYIDITNVLADNSILESVTCVDLSDKISLKIQIGDRFIISVGDYLELPTKMTFAKNIIDRLEEGDKGIIDVSNDKKASFLKKDEIAPLLQ